MWDRRPTRLVEAERCFLRPRKLGELSRLSLFVHDAIVVNGADLDRRLEATDLTLEMRLANGGRRSYPALSQPAPTYQKIDPLGTQTGVRQMRRLAVLLPLAVLSLVRCSGSDERVAAVQKAFDANARQLTWEYVETGNDCFDGGSMETDPSKYVGVSGAIVGPEDDRVAKPLRYCRTVSWDPKYVVAAHEVLLGRYVVDKVGPTEDTMGIQSAPVRAKLQLTALGQSMIDHQLVSSNRLVYTSYVTFSKDVDGRTTATLPLSFAPGL